MLQMAIKVVNITAGPDDLVPTLLVFWGISQNDKYGPPAPTTIQRTSAIKSAVQEVRRKYAKRKVTDALCMRNGPRFSNLYELPINSKVFVWHEERGWTGPYVLLSLEDQKCTINLPSGPTLFRITVVKLYLTDEHEDIK